MYPSDVVVKPEKIPFPRAMLGVRRIFYPVRLGDKFEHILSVNSVPSIVNPFPEKGLATVDACYGVKIQANGLIYLQSS